MGSLNSIPWMVWDAKFWYIAVINEMEQDIEWESVWVELEWVQSKTNKTLSSAELTLEEKEEILFKLDDVHFLEALMADQSVNTSEMLLIIENANIIFDKKSWYQIYIQLETWDDYYIEMSTYNKVFNAFYAN